MIFGELYNFTRKLVWLLYLGLVPKINHIFIHLQIKKFVKKWNYDKNHTNGIIFLLKLILKDK